MPRASFALPFFLFALGCRASEAKPTPPDAGAEAGAEAGAHAEAAPEAVAVALTDAAAAAEAVADAAADAAADAEADAATDPDAGAVPVCPAEMIKIGRYCVDRWEGHLVTGSADGAFSPWPHHDRLKDDLQYIARSDPGFFPQAYISRVEAKAACEHAGKRLCSRAEWTRACKGRHGYRYPYGNKGKSGTCNTGKPHLLEKFFGQKRNWTYEIFNDPKLDREPGFLGKTSEYEACQSDEGVHDMVGNLHEWVSDMVDSDIEEILAKDEVERKKQPWKVGNGIFMGGFFSTTLEHGPGCSFTTIAHEPRYHDYSTGFRCCSDVPGLEKPGKKKKKKKG